MPEEVGQVVPEEVGQVVPEEVGQDSQPFPFFWSGGKGLAHSVLFLDSPGSAGGY